MNQNQQHLEDLRAIKITMERSSRFLSLSGLSGISAGVTAIAGALVARIIIDAPIIKAWDYSRAFTFSEESSVMMLRLLITAGVVLLVASGSATWFSWRKAIRAGDKIWTPVTRRLLISLTVPLGAGGLFILFTLGNLEGSMIAAMTLVFYGLALVSASKYTLGDIFWLGITEIVVGLVSLLLPGYVFIFWVFGFGILHIVYGILMHIRYR